VYQNLKLAYKKNIDILGRSFINCSTEQELKGLLEFDNGYSLFQLDADVKSGHILKDKWGQKTYIVDEVRRKECLFVALRLCLQTHQSWGDEGAGIGDEVP